MVAQLTSIFLCRDARVMWDHSTGRSKGYGFVSFRNREDAERAIQEMHGRLIGSRPVRCGWAQHKQVGHKGEALGEELPNLLDGALFFWQTPSVGVEILFAESLNEPIRA